MPATPPDRRLFFLLSAGARRVQRWVDGELAGMGGLTQAQSGLLFFLGKDGGALIGEAAEALDVAPSAMTGLVDRMERSGLIERRADPDDGRAQRLFLTDAGRAARTAALDGLKDLNATLTDGFSEAEVATIARWLSSLPARFPRR
jgi:DNA-binding MarR family transcriptional regulator